MHAATSMNTNSATRKAVRRSPRWVGGHPHRAAKRTVLRSDEPTIVRFPTKPAAAAAESQNASAEDVARKMREVRATWSTQEKERRRLQAAAKQHELLMLLAEAELEDTMRRAVADAEQPVVAPEMYALRG